MRSLHDVNRGGRAVALAVAGALVGSLLYLVAAWPQARKQEQCEALGERVTYAAKRLTKRLRDHRHQWPFHLQRAGGDAKEAVHADSKEFLSLGLSGELQEYADELVGAFLGLGDAAEALDGSPSSRERFDAERARLRAAIESTRKACVP